MSKLESNTPKCAHRRIDDYRETKTPDSDGVYHDSEHCADCGQWLTFLTRERPSHVRMTTLLAPALSKRGGRGFDLYLNQRAEELAHEKRLVDFKVAHLQAALASTCECPMCARVRHSLTDGSLPTTSVCAVCKSAERPVTPLCDVCRLSPPPEAELAKVLAALKRLYVAALCAAGDEDSPVASTDGSCYTLRGDYETILSAIHLHDWKNR